MRKNYFFSFLIFLVVLAGCKKSEQSDNTSSARRKDSLEVLFTYGSEKEKWIKEATKAHLTSPASAAFIQIGNAKSRTKTGKDLIASTENLVLSPVVIAMWKPMAEAIGWGKRAVGWSDILSLAQKEEGWAAFGHPEWGRFKFGHTHPQYSNSGLISMFAESYAAAGKVSGLTTADLQRADIVNYVRGIEQSVVHYGSSTGFFGRKLFENGPQYLSAAVLYENMVIESYSQEYKLPFPVIAIYPKEGTFWSDHPAGIVERDWVTAEHREAAKNYVQYLLQRPQQEKAIEYGFRPAAVDVALRDPVSKRFGVDPQEPKTTMDVPTVEVMDAIIRLWNDCKKRSDIVLVMDISGSMKDERKMEQAKPGAATLLSMLSDEDLFSLLLFNDRTSWVFQSAAVKGIRQKGENTIQNLFSGGGTALYDAVDQGYQYLIQNKQPNRISAVIVLTDGDDTDSRMNFEQLRSRIRFDSEKRSVRVFTIGYGSAPKKDLLQAIADATQAKFYSGTPENIQSVFQDISTFF
jgi:Ca-activated chloride channel family protein